jgi:hypothetical protein
MEETKVTRKTLIDYILPEDYDRFNELLAKAEEAKANAPKKPRGPQTVEQKIAAQKARLAKAEAMLAALLAEAESEE